MTNGNATLFAREADQTAERDRWHPAGKAELPVARVRVDGKFLARGNQRLTVQGVTYGPFAPDEEGQQIPPRRQVRDDFVAMTEGGINAIRTYHVPPEWVLGLADEHGINVFIDI